RDVEATAHAPGVALDDPVRGLVEAEAVEQVAGTRTRLGGAHVEQPTDELQVLEPREALVDRCVLAGEADAGARGARVGDDVDPVDDGTTGVGFEEGGEDADCGGLPGSVGTEHT